MISNMHYATWISRVGAQIVDGLIGTVLGAIPLILLFAVDTPGGAVGIVLMSMVVWVVIGVIYAPLLMRRHGLHNGQTWGKQAMPIHVRRDSGEEVDFPFAFLREFVVKGLLFGAIGGMLFYIPTLVNYLWPLWDSENRCLHDMIVKTHVYRGDATEEVAAGEPPPPVGSVSEPPPPSGAPLA